MCVIKTPASLKFPLTFRRFYFLSVLIITPPRQCNLICENRNRSIESIHWSAVVNYSCGVASLHTRAGVEAQVEYLFESEISQTGTNKNRSSVTLI